MTVTPEQVLVVQSILAQQIMILESQVTALVATNNELQTQLALKTRQLEIADAEVVKLRNDIELYKESLENAPSQVA